MITLCIRYTIDPSKLAAFETYARALRAPIERCGGTAVTYHLPTKLAGPTNQALGLIDFPDLGAYETYRARLAADPGGIDAARHVEESGAILVEDRAFMRRVTDA